jgi:hypothetical protein
MSFHEAPDLAGDEVRIFGQADSYAGCHVRHCRQFACPELAPPDRRQIPRPLAIQDEAQFDVDGVGLELR